jgi:hypothetical protein
MLCDEKLQRVLDYNVAAAEFSEALAVLHTRCRPWSRDEYERLQNVVDERRIVTEQIRLIFERHVSEHGC